MFKYIVGGIAMNTANQGCQCGSNRSQERLLNQSEVAELLCVSPKTFEYFRWKKCGGPKWVKIGKLARYRYCDVMEYVEQLGQVK
jgi:predicted DNA-binding transcriptional regulator AlpA